MSKSFYKPSHLSHSAKLTCLLPLVIASTQMHSTGLAEDLTPNLFTTPTTCSEEMEVAHDKPLLTDAPNAQNNASQAALQWLQGGVNLQGNWVLGLGVTGHARCTVQSLVDEYELMLKKREFRKAAAYLPRYFSLTSTLTGVSCFGLGKLALLVEVDGKQLGARFTGTAVAPINFFDLPIYIQAEVASRTLACINAASGDEYAHPSPQVALSGHLPFAILGVPCAVGVQGQADLCRSEKVNTVSDDEPASSCGFIQNPLVQAVCHAQLPWVAFKLNIPLNQLDTSVEGFQAQRFNLSVSINPTVKVGNKRSRKQSITSYRLLPLNNEPLRRKQFSTEKTFVQCPKTMPENDPTLDASSLTSFAQTPEAMPETSLTLDASSLTSFAQAPEAKPENSLTLDASSLTSFALAPEAMPENSLTLDASRLKDYRTSAGSYVKELSEALLVLSEKNTALQKCFAASIKIFNSAMPEADKVFDAPTLETFSLGELQFEVKQNILSGVVELNFIESLPALYFNYLAEMHAFKTVEDAAHFRLGISPRELAKQSHDFQLYLSENSLARKAVLCAKEQMLANITSRDGLKKSLKNAHELAINLLNQGSNWEEVFPLGKATWPASVLTCIVNQVLHSIVNDFPPIYAAQENINFGTLYHLSGHLTANSHMLSVINYIKEADLRAAEQLDAQTTDINSLSDRQYLDQRIMALKLELVGKWVLENNPTSLFALSLVHYYQKASLLELLGFSETLARAIETEKLPSIEQRLGELHSGPKSLCYAGLYDLVVVRSFEGAYSTLIKLSKQVQAFSRNEVTDKGIKVLLKKLEATLDSYDHQSFAIGLAKTEKHQYFRSLTFDLVNKKWPYRVDWNYLEFQDVLQDLDSGRFKLTCDFIQKLEEYKKDLSHNLKKLDTLQSNLDRTKEEVAQAEKERLHSEQKLNILKPAKGQSETNEYRKEMEMRQKALRRVGKGLVNERIVKKDYQKTERNCNAIFDQIIKVVSNYHVPKAEARINEKIGHLKANFLKYSILPGNTLGSEAKEAMELALKLNNDKSSDALLACWPEVCAYLNINPSSKHNSYAENKEPARLLEPSGDEILNATISQQKQISDSRSSLDSLERKVLSLEMLEDILSIYKKRIPSLKELKKAYRNLEKNAIGVSVDDRYLTERNEQSAWLLGIHGYVERLPPFKPQIIPPARCAFLAHASIVNLINVLPPDMSFENKRELIEKFVVRAHLWMLENQDPGAKGIIHQAAANEIGHFNPTYEGALYAAVPLNYDTYNLALGHAFFGAVQADLENLETTLPLEACITEFLCINDNTALMLFFYAWQFVLASQASLGSAWNLIGSARLKEDNFLAERSYQSALKFLSTDEANASKLRCKFDAERDEYEKSLLKTIGEDTEEDQERETSINVLQTVSEATQSGTVYESQS